MVGNRAGLSSNLNHGMDLSTNSPATQSVGKDQGQQGRNYSSGTSQLESIFEFRASSVVSGDATEATIHANSVKETSVRFPPQPPAPERLNFHVWVLSGKPSDIEGSHVKQWLTSQPLEGPPL